MYIQAGRESANQKIRRLIPILLSQSWSPVGYNLDRSDKHDNISAFRVDRMIEPTVLNDKAVPKPKDFNVSVYAHKVFEMYDGDEVRVKLERRNELMKYVVDRFGVSLETEPSNGETFICYADVRLSPTFYGWVFGFKGGMKILEPGEAVEELKEMATRVLDAYGNRLQKSCRFNCAFIDICSL